MNFISLSNLASCEHYCEFELKLEKQKHKSYGNNCTIISNCSKCKNYFPRLIHKWTYTTFCFRFFLFSRVVLLITFEWDFTWQAWVSKSGIRDFSICFVSVGLVLHFPLKKREWMRRITTHCENAAFASIIAENAARLYAEITCFWIRKNF